MEKINQKYFMLINSFAHQNHLVDMLGLFLGEFMPYAFIAIEVCLYFFGSKKKESVLAFEAMLIGLGVNQIIGLFYFHNRPFMDHLGILLHKHAPDSSFPSDHTTFMLSIAFLFLFCKRTRNLSYILILLGFIGGFARVFEGVHYPFDIIGGIGTGLVGAVTVFIFKTKLEPINNFIVKSIKGFKR